MLSLERRDTQFEYQDRAAPSLSVALCSTQPSSPISGGIQERDVAFLCLQLRRPFRHVQHDATAHDKQLSNSRLGRISVHLCYC